MRQYNSQANLIVELLSIKHSDDVFVPECKDGATTTRNHLRMDAWAMKRSWTSPCVTAYEVKVSRSDWLKDQKFQAYLKYCNQFYVVAPKGILTLDELPDGVGYLEVSKNFKVLYTRKKATYRDVNIPVSVYKYILMSRAKIAWDSTFAYVPPDSQNYFISWLHDKQRKQELDHRIKGEIRKRHREVLTRNEELVRENEKLRDRMKDYDVIQERLAELGVDPQIPIYSWNADAVVDLFTVPKKIVTGKDIEVFEAKINNIASALNVLRKAVKDLEVV